MIISLQMDNHVTVNLFFRTILFSPKTFDLKLNFFGNKLVFKLNWYIYANTCTTDVAGAQWLSGRVLDSRPRGRRFEPHQRHCAVILEQDTFILA